LAQGFSRVVKQTPTEERCLAAMQLRRRHIPPAIQRRPPVRPPKRLKVTWVAAAAVGFALVSAGKLFVAPQSSSTRLGATTSNYSELQVSIHTRLGASPAVLGSQSNTTTSVTSCLGGLILLCASAAARGRRQQSKRINVACYATWTVSESMPLSVKTGFAVDPCVEPVLPQLASEEALPVAAAPEVHAAGGHQQGNLLEGLRMLAGLEMSVPVASTPVVPSRRASAARFAGGARRSRSHGRTKKPAATGCRASRRSVGAKLQQQVHNEVLPLSFDASCLRLKIQLGLRVPSCLCSERGRESKTPSTSKGSDMSTGVRIQANEFGQRRTRQSTR